MSTRDLIKSGVVLYICVLLLGFVWAEAGAEERTVTVVGFDFETAEVVLEDEDGFIWSCPFSRSDWVINEEYILVLEEGSDPQIIKP